MSSPMMNMMLGFFSCAAAGATPAAVAASAIGTAAASRTLIELSSIGPPFSWPTWACNSQFRALSPWAGAELVKSLGELLGPCLEGVVDVVPGVEGISAPGLGAGAL